MIVFKDEIFSIQREKTSFVCLLWSKTKRTTPNSPSNIVGLLIE